MQPCPERSRQTCCPRKIGGGFWFSGGFPRAAPVAMGMGFSIAFLGRSCYTKGSLDTRAGESG